MVDCEYIEICSDANTHLCSTCKHNKSKSYYEPNSMLDPWDCGWAVHWVDTKPYDFSTKPKRKKSKKATK